MTFEEQLILERMPAADRARVMATEPLYRGQLVRLWAAAEQNGAHAPPSRKADPEAAAAKQDTLDEQLLKRCIAGEYGKGAKEVIAECERQCGPGVERRTFLRAVRKAVEAARRSRQ